MGDAVLPYVPGADPRELHVIDTCTAATPHLPTAATCDRISMRLFENGAPSGRWPHHPLRLNPLDFAQHGKFVN
jgi:hypothetical protein